jgi:hypothetical protein
MKGKNLKINIIIILLISSNCKPSNMTKSNLTEQSILETLDNANDGYYCHFLNLGHPYSYLIDCRLNIFRDDNGNWAIAAERCGFSERAGIIDLTIDYFGNCLTNLESYNNRPSNTIFLHPFDTSFYETVDVFLLKPDAKKWILRGREIPLIHDKKDYEQAGIKLTEFEPNTIKVEEAARLSILKYREYFRATDEELYKCIPKNLKRVLVLDEWYHKDFYVSENITEASLTEEKIRESYEFGKKELQKLGIDYESFKKSLKEQKIQEDKYNKDLVKNNSPSTYETWRMIAKVIVTGNIKHYKPTLKPNTHWSNYPESGSL